MKKHGLDAYYKKLHKEAILKSWMISSMIGFSLMIVLSIIFYLMSFNGLLISVISFLVTIIISSYVLKTYVFNVSIKTIAHKLDDLGLEERVLTMIEFSEIESLIVQKQRITAQEKLANITPKHIGFKHFMRMSLILSLIFGLAVISVTFSTVAALNKEDNTVIPEEELTIEEALIARLIEELRRLVETADVRQTLKNELNFLIDALEDRIKLDDTLILKVARIEETRRIILERIALEKEIRTTIVDELILKETTNVLGSALKTEDELTITNTINLLIENFLTLTISEMQAFVEAFELDIETSIEDADIKNSSLEQDLRDLVKLLKSLIPETEGDEPKDVSDEVDALVESILESLEVLTPEEALEEEVDETIQETIDALLGNQEPEEPEEPEEEEEEGEDEPWDPLDQDDSETGEGTPVTNPTVIDGLTPYDRVLYEAMLESLRALFESNQITDEELINIINNYMNSIEIN
jgi:uncharacterized protein YeeX (DUF496 family)